MDFPETSDVKSRQKRKRSLVSSENDIISKLAYLKGALEFRLYFFDFLLQLPHLLLVP
jgi:hypothetical protein